MVQEIPPTLILLCHFMQGKAFYVHERVLFWFHTHLVESLDLFKLTHEEPCLFDLFIPVLHALHHSRERSHERCYRRSEHRGTAEQRNLFFRESPAAPVPPDSGFIEKFVCPFIRGGKYPDRRRGSPALMT